MVILGKKLTSTTSSGLSRNMPGLTCAARLTTTSASAMTRSSSEDELLTSRRSNK